MMSDRGSDTVLVRTVDAAEILNIADRTVRKRLNNGELHGQKINGAWLVELPRNKVEAAGIEIPDPEEGDEDLPVVAGLTRSGRAGSGTGPMPEPVDMAPMAELIADLTRKSIEAAAAAAMWQERAQVLAEQQKSTTLALEVGKQQHQEEVERARKEASAEARKEVESEWRSKSWWQRMRGE